MTRLVLVLALLSTPVVALAACYGGDQQAMSCAENTTWDPVQEACVPIVTG